MSVTAEPPALQGDTTMAELLRMYPGAQRALFARYHIGGCSSCGFRPDETLAQVCARNDNVPVDEAVEHIVSTHDADQKIQVTPLELSEILARDPSAKLLDARSREEHEAVQIPGSRLITQDLIQTIFDTWPKTTPVVIYDHQGTRALDAAAYFIGHGFSETKCLSGGIDAYSLEVDPAIPRYRVELED